MSAGSSNATGSMAARTTSPKRAAAASLTFGPNHSSATTSSRVRTHARPPWHARDGAVDDLYAAAEEWHGDRAWVRTRDQVIAEEWFGPKVSPAAAARFGDVVLAAQAPVAFEDPADTGPYRLQSRHGSLTSAEMRIPLLAVRA